MTDCVDTKLAIIISLSLSLNLQTSSACTGGRVKLVGMALCGKAFRLANAAIIAHAGYY